MGRRGEGGQREADSGPDPAQFGPSSGPDPHLGELMATRDEKKRAISMPESHALKVTVISMLPTLKYESERVKILERSHGHPGIHFSRGRSTRFWDPVQTTASGSHYVLVPLICVNLGANEGPSFTQCPGSYSVPPL